MQMMNAAVLTGAGKLKIVAVPVPEPGPGQVRVRLEGCGVCASNLTPWEGPEWMRFPTDPGVLGHEGWGVVDAIGEGANDLAPGDRVGMLSGKAYAQYDLADALQLVKLPDALAELHGGSDDIGCRLCRPHYLQQAHHVCGAEKMQADHVLRAGDRCRDVVDVLPSP